MKCNFDLCIYNRELACILNEAEIDTLGMCKKCELVLIPREILEKYKNIHLKGIEGIWENYEANKASNGV